MERKSWNFGDIYLYLGDIIYERRVAAYYTYF
jgi:hypothetical protein